MLSIVMKCIARGGVRKAGAKLFHGKVEWISYLLEKVGRRRGGGQFGVSSPRQEREGRVVARCVTLLRLYSVS